MANKKKGVKVTKILSGPKKKSISGKNNEVVIFFHGYGADGNDLISLSDSFSKILPDAIFYSPNAPEKCYMGGFGYQWFPIKQNNDGSLDLYAEKEILNSIKLINNYIDKIEFDTGINSKDFILIGFSQGTMMILETLLSREKKISAIIGFSGGFLNITDKISKINFDTPILLIHGDADNVVPKEMTSLAQKNLNSLGYCVDTYFSNGLSHGISLDGLTKATQFLKK